MKKVIALIISIGIVGLLLFLFLPSFLDIYQSRSAAKEVLDHVIDQEYEEAFESIYFFDVGSDIEPIISYQDAKNKWVQRVIELREHGIYVVDYQKLRVRLDDTYPTGIVDLVIWENGEKKVKNDVRLWFAPTEDKWKLGNIHHSEEGWEKALSGDMN